MRKKSGESNREPRNSELDGLDDWEAMPTSVSDMPGLIALNPGVGLKSEDDTPDESGFRIGASKGGTPKGGSAGVSIESLAPNVHSVAPTSTTGATPTIAQRRVGVGYASFAAGVAVSMTIGIGVGVFASTQTEPAPTAASVASVAAPGPTSQPSGAVGEPPAAPSILDRARVGEPSALAKLAERPARARTVDEAIAVAEGRIAQKHAALDDFQLKLEGDPNPLEDRADVIRLGAFVTDPDTTLRAAAFVVALPGATGPDLLYDLWSRTKKSNDITRLAHELVQSEEVRSKASPALHIALDLRGSEQCAELASLLPQARENADARSVRPLKKLLRRRGCLDKDAMVEARAALSQARRRKAPRLR